MGKTFIIEQDSTILSATMFSMTTDLLLIGVLLILLFSFSAVSYVCISHCYRDADLAQSAAGGEFADRKDLNGEDKTVGNKVVLVVQRGEDDKSNREVDREEEDEGKGTPDQTGSTATNSGISAATTLKCNGSSVVEIVGKAQNNHIKTATNGNATFAGGGERSNGGVTLRPTLGQVGGNSNGWKQTMVETTL